MVPTRIKIFDNPSALCLALWAKNRVRLSGGLMHPIGSLRREHNFLSLHLKYIKNPPSDLLCLRSSRSKCNTSTINYYLLVFTSTDESFLWCILLFSPQQVKAFHDAFHANMSKHFVLYPVVFMSTDENILWCIPLFSCQQMKAFYDAFHCFMSKDEIILWCILLFSCQQMKAFYDAFHCFHVNRWKHFTMHSVVFMSTDESIIWCSPLFSCQQMKAFYDVFCCFYVNSSQMWYSHRDSEIQWHW